MMLNRGLRRLTVWLLRSIEVVLIGNRSAWTKFDLTIGISLMGKEELD